MAKSKIQLNMEETRARVLADLQKKGKPRLTAQSLFMSIAKSMGLRVRRHAVSDFTEVKPVVRAMINAGELIFRHVEGGTSFYTIPSVDQITGNSAHKKGEATFDLHQKSKFAGCQSGSIHEKAGKLIASKPWIINVDHLKEAETKLSESYMFDDGKWVPAQAEDEAYKAQCLQAQAVREILQSMGGVVSFDVSCDDRGRFYVRGGYASPYMGKLGRFFYTDNDDICLDHRTSFAQNFALITGNCWGKYCGVGNANPTDFWTDVLAQWGANVPPKSLLRKGCKKYGTPCFYGSGTATAENDSNPIFEQALARGECTEAELRKVKDALAKFAEVVSAFGEKTRDFAHSFAIWGEQPHWLTPSGFKACKEYWHSQSIAWNSGENTTCYYPKSMSFLIKTGRICERPAKDSTDKSVLVATCANILQSLDASIMAKTICKFHEETGMVLFPLHDSYTIPRQYKDVLIHCVVESMREVADSEEVKTLRNELGLPPVKVIVGRAKPDPDMINLDMRKMCPLDEE